MSASDIMPPMSPLEWSIPGTHTQAQTYCSRGRRRHASVAEPRSVRVSQSGLFLITLRALRFVAPLRKLQAGSKLDRGHVVDAPARSELAGRALYRPFGQASVAERNSVDDLARTVQEVHGARDGVVLLSAQDA